MKILKGLFALLLIVILFSLQLFIPAIFTYFAIYYLVGVKVSLYGLFIAVLALKSFDTLVFNSEEH